MMTGAYYSKLASHESYTALYEMLTQQNGLLEMLLVSKRYAASIILSFCNEVQTHQSQFKKKAIMDTE
jgi:hypothetical protein